MQKMRCWGIFHTDELPAYGVTAAETTLLRERMGAAEGDGVVIIAGTAAKVACAIQQVRRRAALAIQGVPEETRRMMEGGSTAYMRPLPGAARMYPETDVLPVEITSPLWEGDPGPHLSSRRKRHITFRNSALTLQSHARSPTLTGPLSSRRQYRLGFDRTRRPDTARDHEGDQPGRRRHLTSHVR